MLYNNYRGRLNRTEDSLVLECLYETNLKDMKWPDGRLTSLQPARFIPCDECVTKIGRFGGGGEVETSGDVGSASAGAFSVYSAVKSL